MALITRHILGERCSTKEAVQLLEAGGVLECIPHEVDPDARLTNAAIAMRRSEWWWQVPVCYQGQHRGHTICIPNAGNDYLCEHIGDQAAGEINAR